MTSGSHNPVRPHRRRSVALVTVLLLLTLLIAVVGEIVSASGAEAILAARQANDLRHQLAVDSTIDLLARLLATDPAAKQRLDRGEPLQLAFDLEACQVAAVARNDGAKFDPAAFGAASQANRLADKLRTIGRRKGLPAAAVQLRPLPSSVPGARPYLWFDQLFERPDPLALFAWPGDPRGGDRWSDWLTVFGTGQVDLAAADEPVLTAMLDDIESGLGRHVQDNRPRAIAHGEDAVEIALQGIEEQAVRDAARRRLAWQLGRYSLQVASRCGADVRVFYVVLRLPPPADARGAVQVLLRRQIRW